MIGHNAGNAHKNEPILLSTSINASRATPSDTDLRKNGSSSSIDTVHRPGDPRPYASSKGSPKSIPSGSLAVQNENTGPPRTISQSTIDFNKGSRNVSGPRINTAPYSHQLSLKADLPFRPRSRAVSNANSEIGPLEDIDLNAGCDDAGNIVPFKRIKDANQDVRRDMSFEANGDENLSAVEVNGSSATGFGKAVASVDEHSVNPFKKWMKSLRKNHPKHGAFLSGHGERFSLDETDSSEVVEKSNLQDRGRKRHKRWSNASSNGFVTGVRSVSMSLVSVSDAPHSRKGRRSFIRSGKRNSKLSDTANRNSTESNFGSVQILHDEAWDRSVQRRKILEELVSSEESYISDLKVLVNVYIALLATAPHVTEQAQKQIHCNVEELLQLHQELLARIRDALSNADLRSDSLRLEGLGKLRRNIALLTRHDHSRKDALTAEPQEVAEVAKIFDSMLFRFFTYEEYGARYESMFRNMLATTKTMPNWQAYERGIESLANLLAPTGSKENNNKKGLTFGDLLIKPIQRITKYPLLFTDLYKHTPIIDSAESHAEIEKVLCRLKETAQEINKATNDKRIQERIQRSWLLQDLLVFSHPITTPFALRMLGHPILCGVLHVAYQTRQTIRGDYMLCVLFKPCLILATPDATGRQYQIVACIGLGDLRVESTEGGKGLQCPNAYFSWKIIFESDQNLFEAIFSACSVREEEVWRMKLLECSAKESQKQAEGQSTSPVLYSILTLDIKPIGNVLGHPGTLARRISIQRAATVGGKAQVRQVYIHNTHALQQPGEIPLLLNAPLNRSRSLISPSRAILLAPKRATRIKMESMLSGVWTKDILHYPGMNFKRGDRLIRASANSVMRRLSRQTSVASGSRERSVSVASLTSSRLFDDQDNEDDDEGTASYQPTATASAPATPHRDEIELLRNSPIIGSGRSRGNRLYKEQTKLQASKFRTVEEVDTISHGLKTSMAKRTEEEKERGRKPLFKSFSKESIKALFN